MELGAPPARSPWVRSLPSLLTTGLPLLLGLSCLFYDGPGHRFWRAHAGDIFVVAFLVGLLAVFTNHSFARRAFLVGILCTGLEVGQLGGVGAHRTGIVALVLGTHFDAMDFLWYAVGIVLAMLLQRAGRRLAASRDCQSFTR